MAGNQKLTELDPAVSVDGADLLYVVQSGTSKSATASLLPVSDAQTAAFQPLDSDLTAIAALGTTTFGRARLTDADAAAAKTALSLVKADVGLGNVDNTADTAKPVSTAQQTALDLKANIASPAFTGTPTSIDYEARNVHQVLSIGTLSSVSYIQSYDDTSGVASSPLAFYGASEIARFDASGNLGLGTTSPSDKLSVTGNASVTGNVAVGGAVFSGVGTNGRSELQPGTGSQAGFLAIWRGGAAVREGYIGYETGVMSYTLEGGASHYFTGLVETATGQIKFPATQNPSSDPNTLDDYEEGTWTPVLSFGGASVGITYSSRSGAYTKIGNIVTSTLSLVLSSKGTSTGIAAITGLPFTSAVTAVANLSIGNGVLISAPLSYTNGAALGLQNIVTTGYSNFTDSNLGNTSDIYTTNIYTV